MKGWINMEWRPVKGYENEYSVSDTGLVYSHRRNKVLKNQHNKEGYVRIHLSKDRSDNITLVHRLVAEAFIPNPNNYHEINHRDESRDNNTVSNLEWCTRTYNNNYGTKIKRMVAHTDYTKLSVLFGKRVVCMTLDGEYINTFTSIKSAAREFGLCEASVSKCCNGARNKAGQYKFAFAV
jgi:hypothetical protein